MLEKVKVLEPKIQEILALESVVTFYEANAEIAQFDMSDEEFEKLDSTKRISEYHSKLGTILADLTLEELRTLKAVVALGREKNNMTDTADMVSQLCLHFEFGNQVDAEWARRSLTDLIPMQTNMADGMELLGLAH